MISPSSLLHLESPYGEYKAAETSARDILLTGLKMDTPYWPEQALGWLEQGMPVDAGIAEQLASIVERPHWPQRLRHRAKALLKSWRSKNDAGYFQLAKILPNGLVIGRNAYTDIPVGSQFVSLRKSKIVRSDTDYQTEDLGEIAEIALRLDKVEWFRRFIDLVPRGHTAGLHLSGSGLEKLAEALQGCQKGEYVSIHLSRC